jgi:hypothetical protein
MSNRYIVSYNVTVDVLVDLETMSIDKVVINDDCMGDPYAYFKADDFGTIQEEIWMTGHIADHDNDELIGQLYKIVENSDPDTPDIEWPSWSHGW